MLFRSGLDIVHGGRVFKNDGSGNFTLFSSDGLLAMPDDEIAVADFDGDNDLDVIRSGNGTVPWTFWRNGTPPLVTTVTPPRNGNGSVNPNIAAIGTPVTVNFSTTITTNTYSVPPAQQLFQVHGSFTGKIGRAHV